MYTNRNHPTMVLPLLIVIFYFLHFQLIFKPISLLSMIVILLIVPLCYSIFRKFSSSRFPVLLLLFSTLIIILVFIIFPSTWHSLYNATLDTYRQYSTLKFYPFG